MLPLLFFIFCVAIVIQLFYYIFLFSKFYAFAEEKPDAKKTQPVSVVIAAKNEAENLQQFLPKILAQEHQNFEVIVVNDASTDNTLEVLNSLKDERLKVVTIPTTENYSGNKKNAISQGISVAKHENLLFTDADCYPTSENLITEMTSHLNSKEVVLGYGAYEKLPTFINKLIRYETLLTAIQYFSYAKAGVPYMGVGRNLAYKKALFSRANGFETHKNIKSGDDDLFINQIANKQNTAISSNEDSFTISKPETSFKKWFQQKRRHISTANHYKPLHQFLLSLFYASQLLFWVLAILLVAFSFNWKLVITLVGIRCIVHYIAIGASAKKLKEKDILLLAPLLDFILVFTQLRLFFTNLLHKPTHW